MTDSIYRDPAPLLESMAQHVNPLDGCTECGYQFGYQHEGCDACLPIKYVLLANGMTFDTDN